jgi:hypothetical protein
MNPAQYLGRWLKDHPRASQAHRVLRYDRDLLICYCGRVIPVGDAAAPSNSVACCPSCTGPWRKHEADRQKAFENRYVRRRAHVQPG